MRKIWKFLLIGALALILLVPIFLYPLAALAPYFVNTVWGIFSSSITIHHPEFSSIESVPHDEFRTIAERIGVDYKVPLWDLDRSPSASWIKTDDEKPINLATVRIPGTDDHLALFRPDYHRDEGILRAIIVRGDGIEKFGNKWFDKENIVGQIQLSGATPQNLHTLFMTSPDTLVIRGTSRLPNPNSHSLDIDQLFQYDLRSGILLKKFAQDVSALFGVRQDDRTSIVLYTTANQPVGISILEPKESHLRLYTEKFPEGLEIVTVRYFNGGRIMRVFFDGPTTIYFSTHKGINRKSGYAFWKIILRTNSLL